MNKRLSMALLLLVSLIFIPTSVNSADQAPVYGSQLMTDQERVEHRKRMRNASNAEEREQIRKEHHERMKIRAKQRGITLPDQPPMRGRKGMGPAKGVGPKDGSGQGEGDGMAKGKRKS